MLRQCTRFRQPVTLCHKRCFPGAYPKNLLRRSGSSSSAGLNETGDIPLMVERMVDGLSVRFGTGSVANLARSSVIGTAGQNLVLATVSTESQEEDETSGLSIKKELNKFLSKDNHMNFTVSYQERHHAVGKIPLLNRARQDTLRSSDDEVLAGRAIDRALRPLVVSPGTSVHVACSVQAHEGRGHPAALALNAASVALGDLLSERVGSVHLCLLDDGTLVLDPTHSQVQKSLAELLYAGTRERIIMLEANSPTKSIPENLLMNLINFAHKAVQPIIDTQEMLVAEEKEDDPSDAELRESLGLDLIVPTHKEDTSVAHAEELYNEALEYCKTRFNMAALKLFSGSVDTNEGTLEEGESIVLIHPSNRSLLSKSTRGRRENMLFLEIQKALQTDFTPTSALKGDYQEIADEVAPILASAIHKELVQSALYSASSKFKTRGDNRGAPGYGHETIRTIGVTVPSLPDVVHGSSLFTRGETQVLCTATLGAPNDGMPHTNPFQVPERKAREPGAYDDLPVGSLRYIRSQEAMVSDFNSKRVKAEKEMTGDSGTFEEKRRFFLHYDFPAYSTGKIPSRKGNRREIGHGKLAEKALVSAIPPPSDFPYTTRVTSEVTSSNGSSSMASVCGATLALLDAGVPLVAPVAGVSVGLALGEAEDDYCLLLDITGTEDHYGAMDFKVAGTTDGVTALQLDVKKPLKLSVLEEALDLARRGRLAILNEMEILSKQSSEEIISKLLPRPVFKDSVPRVEVIRFDPLRKKDLIGPGGAVLRQLEDRFDVLLDLRQEGQCLLFGEDKEMVANAKSAVMDLVADVEEGQVYRGTIVGKYICFIFSIHSSDDSSTH